MNHIHCCGDKTPKRGYIKMLLDGGDKTFFMALSFIYSKWLFDTVCYYFINDVTPEKPTSIFENIVYQLNPIIVTMHRRAPRRGRTHYQIYDNNHIMRCYI